MEIKYDIELTREERHDLFITALEGGINHWARRGAVRSSGPFIEAVIYLNRNDAEDYEVNDAYLVDGTVSKFRLDDWIIQLGVDRLAKSKYQHHVQDIAKDNCDAGTADAIVQMALFGDIIY